MATFKFSSPLDLPDAPAPGVPEPAQEAPPMPRSFTDSGPAGFERENLPPEAWPDLNTGEGPGTELVRGTANFLGGGVEGAITGMARMGDDLSGQMSGVNNAINAGLNQITGADLPMRTGNERELMTMRSRVPPLSDHDSAASSAGQFVGEAVAPAVAGGLALQSFRIASAASRLPRHWKDAAELISTLGMGSPTRARVAQQLVAKRAMPGGAPMSPARGQMLSQAQPGIAQRGLAAAGGGAIAGAAGNPGDPGTGAALGAAMGPVAGGAIGGAMKGGSAAADWVARQYAKRAQAAQQNPAQGISDQMLGGMLQYGDGAPAVGARVAAARAGDIVPTAPIYQQGDDAGLTAVHKFLDQRNPGYGVATANVEALTQKRLSDSLASRSAGLEDDYAAREMAIGPAREAMRQDPTKIDAAGVKQEFDKLMGEHVGRDTVTDRLQSLGGKLDGEPLTANEIFNRRAAINDRLRADYDPQGAGLLKPLDKSVKAPLRQLARAMRDAIHDGQSPGAFAAQQIDQMMQASTSINAKEVFLGILEKSVSNAANKQAADGTKFLLSSQLSKQIDRVAKNPKNWGKLNDEEQRYLKRLAAEVRRNQGAELKGAPIKADTAKNLLNDLMPKDPADLPVTGKLATLVKELATGRSGLEDEVLKAMTGTMTDPKAFGEAIARINYAAAQKQITQAQKKGAMTVVRQAIMRAMGASGRFAATRAPIGVAANASRTLGPAFGVGPEPMRLDVNGVRQ